MVLSNGSLKCPERLFHNIFFLYFWCSFFLINADLKRVERSRTAKISRFLSWYFNVNNPTLWISLSESSLHSHNTEVFIVESFLLEVISRSQLPQNSKILFLCFRRRLLQNQCGSDWNITVCAVLVSPYSFHELPLPNSMRTYLFVTWKS